MLPTLFGKLILEWFFPLNAILNANFRRKKVAQSAFPGGPLPNPAPEGGHFYLNG